MEHKITRAISTKVTDAAQGIVKAIFAVFGNVDLGGDRIHPGAFAKTFSERGLSVKILDAHRTDSGLAAIGRPVELREVGQAELPPQVREEFPTATGGAEATVQFLMDTPEGKGIFSRLAAGALDQWSFAFDTIQTDNTEEMLDGDEVAVRNLRELRLYEISPVLFGMNPATATVSAKADAETEQASDASEDAGKDEGEDITVIEPSTLPPEMQAFIRALAREAWNEMIETDNAPAPDVRAAETDEDQEKAGPVQPPTSNMTLAQVDVMMAELDMELLEVE